MYYLDANKLQHKIGMVQVFMPWKLANATSSDCFSFYPGALVIKHVVRYLWKKLW